MDKFSRRNVLGLAGAGLMAGAAHAAHAAEAPAAWDRECDVLVVGSGYAGLCAAIEARTAGADTLLIEKMVVLGGNSALCGGGIAAPGSDLQKAAGVWLPRVSGGVSSDGPSCSSGPTVFPA